MSSDDASTQEHRIADAVAEADPETNHQIGTDGDDESAADQQAGPLTNSQDEHRPPTDTDHPTGDQQAAENADREPPA